MKHCWYILAHTSPVVVEDIEDGSYLSYMHNIRKGEQRLAFRSDMCVKVISSLPPNDSIVVFRAAGKNYYVRQGDMHTEVAEVH